MNSKKYPGYLRQLRHRSLPLSVWHWRRRTGHIGGTNIVDANREHSKRRKTSAFGGAAEADDPCALGA